MQGWMEVVLRRRLRSPGRSRAWRVTPALLLVPLALLAPLAGAAADDPCAEQAPGLRLCRVELVLPAGETAAEAAPFALPTLALLEITVSPSGTRGYDLYWKIEVGGRLVWDDSTPTESTAADGGAYRSMAILPAGEATLSVERRIAGAPSALAGPTESRVSFEIVLRSLAGSAVAAEAAGGPHDPQLIDRTGDAAGPDYTDVAGAWFDDPVLDDGLFAVGVLVPALAAIDAYDGGPGARLSVRYNVAWEVLGDAYELRWRLLPDLGWDVFLVRVLGPGAEERVLDLPFAIDAPNGTLTAVVPERAVGAPPAGVRFENASLRVVESFGNPALLPNSQYLRTPDTVYDEATERVRAFALGGPEVWRRLAGMESVAAQAIIAPWYAAPLAPDNLPNSLQVLAAIAAGATFLGGILLVRRRRRRLAGLLDEVRAASLLSEADAALAALDALEAHVEDLLRRGRLDAAHHAAVLSHLERAWERAARRRDGA